MQERRSDFAGARIMMTTFGWTGVALWLGLNAAVAAWCMYVTQPDANADSTDHTHISRI